MYLDVYYSLYQWHDDVAQHFVVEEVLAFEELHLFLAVVLEEVCLAVDELVLRAEESPDELLFFGRDTLEALLFHLLEGLYHLFVNLELRCAVLPLIAELTLAQATESQQPSHVEGGIDQYPGHAFELFGVEGTHAGGNDEVGLLCGDKRLQERDGLHRVGRHIRAQHLHSLRIEVVTHLRGRTCTACRSKAMYVQHFIHACKGTKKIGNKERREQN